MFPLQIREPSFLTRGHADDTGTPGRTHGALIPDGYQLSDAFPGLPFICPIRSCRKVLRDMKRLGCHFVNLHRAALLHDNEDGTLSFRGLYHPRIKGVKLPALVVSKGPPDPSEPGPVPPSMVANEALSRIIPQTGMPVAMNSPVANPTKTSEGPLRGDWKTLWNYIRPFMVDHTGEIPPQDGWVSHLITLPRVRDIEWNTPWIFTHPFRDSKPRDISAVIIQVTGELAPVPCAKCARGKGPFKGCIMISSKAQYPPLQRVLACANCFYHYGQTFCSHKAWGLKRAKKILRERKAWGTLHTVGYPSPEDGHDDTIGDDTVNLDPSTWEGPDDEASVQDDDAVGDGQDGKEADQSQGGSGTPPPDFPIIQDAEPGRPYNMWPDSTTGELRSTSGALLPAGYKFDTTTAKRPWICPVRTCRQLFIKMADLGYHFQRAHFASLLTDNGDGTLSIKGVYSSRNITSNGKLLSKSYPYVVSKVSDLQTSTSAGFVQPSLPPSCRPENDVDMSLLATPVREGDGPEDLWGYLQPFLTETTTPPEKGFVRELLTLPRVRRVELLPPKLPDGTFGTQVRKFHEKAARDVASIIIQATGDVPPEPCQRCRAGKDSQGLRSPERCAAGHALGEVVGFDRTLHEGIGVGDGATYIAFSKAYLSTNSVVPVCEDVEFRVDTIHSGGTLTLQPDANKSRLCSIATGKVKVKTGDEPEFTIGPHGMFRIKPGTSCVVQNWMYVDAILHVTVLAGFM
ncbi:hypothetical protein QBC39DRAFT_252901 [Podospora conica]|nr:hypothetical protein QBC39DRAFT_252901 [Schizothecium conicum]